jgi:ABC-2 type transport system permease protein
VRAVGLILAKDLRRRGRAPLAPLVMLAFPFLFAGLIALAFGSGGGRGAPRFKVALVDEDGGLAARLVRGALGQEQAARFLEVTETDRERAMRAIARNRIGGAIVIPEGFSAAVYERRPTQLLVIRNPASALGSVAAEETAEFVALLLEGATNVLAEPLERVRAMASGAARGDAGWAPDAAVAEVATLVNRDLQAVSRFAFPPAIYLAPAEAPEAGSSDGSFQVIFRYVLPGMAAFALFFLAIGLMGDVFRERSLGTLGRQLAAPVGATQVVLGKVLATLVIGLIVAAAMAAIGALLLGARADPGAFALLCAAFLFAVTGFVTLLYGFARNEQQGGTLTSIVLMVMAFLGGSFIPLNSLPGLVRSLAPFTLNYWAIEGFQTLLVAGGDLREIAAPLAVFLAVGAVTVTADAYALRRRVAGGA